MACNVKHDQAMLSNFIESTSSAIETFNQLSSEEKREYYSKLRNEREKATFSMMMKMNPEALTAIRKEFFIRKDAVKVDEFIYIINKHLLNNTGTAVNKTAGTARGISRASVRTSRCSSRQTNDNILDTQSPYLSRANTTPELELFSNSDQREFGLNMYELFKEIDVNGDGDLEWQEFTSFTVERANLLNSRQKLASLGHYHDSSDLLDPSALVRHRHDISNAVVMKSINQFALVEDHKNAIFIFNSRYGRLIHTITTEAAPIAIEYIPDREKDFLVATGADMTMTTFSLDDPNPNRRYQHLQSWATPGVQMALTYQPESKLLYSGGTNGNVYSWNIKDRNLISTMVGHTDIVMSLANITALNNIASASLDKTIAIWDSYTNERVLNLHGHRKGIFDLTYSSDYRLLVSCGFEHDAFIWSPFVNSMMGKLRGHHASLVGCVAIEGKPELITGDTSGVFKLWDVRNYNCVQTFSANTSSFHGSDNFKMSCFFHCSLPSRNAMQKEDDSRLFAASKMLSCFDQARIIHEATTDKTNVVWLGLIEAKSFFVTVSERNVILWDAFSGTKSQVNLNICDEEITACCLDDRQRKILIGSISGNIGVYNLSNGAKMKEIDSSTRKNYGTVTGLAYVNESRRFIAAYQYGVLLVYDENTLEECTLLRSFERIHRMNSAGGYDDDFQEGISKMSFNAADATVATISPASNYANLWNYNTGKLEYELRACGDENEYIINIEFLKPYPLVATSDSVGNVVIWGSRGCRWPGMRLAGFLNQNILNGVYKPNDKVVYSFSEEVQPPIIIPPASANVPLEHIRRAGSHESRVNVNVVPISTNDIIASTRTTPTNSTRANHSDKLTPKGFLDKSSPRYAQDKSVRSKDKSPKGADSTPRNAGYLSKYRSLSLDEFDDGELDTVMGSYNSNVNSSYLNKLRHMDSSQSELALKSISEVKNVMLQSEDKWGSVAPVQAICWSAEKKYIYVADDMGILRCYDVKDLFNDIQADVMISNPSKAHMKDLCRRQLRTVKSALPPCHTSYLRYLVGNPDDAMSNLGINFVYALYAHDDRIVSCQCTSVGVITSAVDRLVKIWTFDGEPMGRLLQSIPAGMKNKAWKLELDTDNIMKKENEELSEILKKVNNLASRKGNPDIENFDFTGLDPGANAADFNRSNLRRRIDMTGKLLGLDFPTNDDIEKQYDSAPLPSYSNIISKAITNLTTTGTSHRRGSLLRQTACIVDAISSEFSSSLNEGSLMSSETMSIFSSSHRISLQSSKSVDAAMVELKSMSSSKDYDILNHALSYRQKKSRIKKMTQISNSMLTTVNQKLGATPSNPLILSSDENTNLITKLPDRNTFSRISHRMNKSTRVPETQEINPSTMDVVDESMSSNDNEQDLPQHFDQPSLMSSSTNITPFPSINELESTAIKPISHGGRSPLENSRNSSIFNPGQSSRARVMEDMELYVKESARNSKLVASCSKYTSYKSLERALSTLDPPSKCKSTIRQRQQSSASSSIYSPREELTSRQSRSKLHDAGKSIVNTEEQASNQYLDA